MQVATPMSTVNVVDYLDLPPPVRYEELQREVMSESFYRPLPGGPIDTR